MDVARIHKLNDKPVKSGPVIYWMSRDQRVRDNWALIHAAFKAAQTGAPLVVIFCLLPTFQGAGWRHYAFMLQGLRELEESLAGMNIAFRVIPGDPVKGMTAAIEEYSAGLVVADFDPLRVKRRWRRTVAAGAKIRCEEVDAHNIAPCRHVSKKQEYAAHTLRPKINKLLPEFLHEYPDIEEPVGKSGPPAVDWAELYRTLEVDDRTPGAAWISPGERAAAAALDDFLRTGLPRYHRDRNDPNLGAVSMLSPYMHFGQLAPQRVALEVEKSPAPAEAKNAYLEELVVRRELSDNFCLYNKDYDSVNGFPEWAKKTLNEHRGDAREYVYTREELERAETHDRLWNAAQRQAVDTAWMHGYMRMYWAKKILEWTESPEQALEYAIYLNDRYQLDGRDPNGYTGIAWSMGGVHDRAWKDRPIFGKIRYMNEKGCRRKFNVDAYIEKYRA